VTRRSPTSKPIERILPVGYLGLALALAALLLPTILRPPQDLQNTTAAFSPDAPPEDTPPEAILQSLRQASSSTAGAAPEVVEEQQQVVIEEVVEEEAPPAKKRQAVRAGCFGDPPRQTESLYSALCVPAWTGTDNGGATSQGVTADEVRIGIGVPVSSAVEEGPLQREFAPDDADTERLLKAWQIYFNERFETYGRYLQFYVVKVESTDEDTARAAVRSLNANYGGVFAYIGHGAATNAAATNVALEQKLVTFAFGNNPVDYYKDAHPYVYGFTMDSWQTRALGAEVICKQYAGKPPGELNNQQDPTFNYGAPRKWGLIIYQDEVRGGAREMYEKNLAKCGEKFVDVAEYNLNDDSSKIAGSVTKLRQKGATSILLAVDPLTPAVVAYEADRTGYYPEWICITGCDTNGTGRLLPDAQAVHFVAMSTIEIPREDADKDWYRAYKEVDPEGEPELDYFRHLQHLAGGIQHAGTNLTPDTFWKGLKTQPCRTPEPIWSIGGCYRDPDPKSELHFLGDYTYVDYASFMWMDNAGVDPNSTTAGAWCYMNAGARYRPGEVPGPDAPLPFRKPDQCIFTPPRGEQG
jgi:hypothetical protein